MGTEDDDTDLPTLLMLGTGDPLCAALEEALGGYATFVEAAPSEAPTSSVLAAAPDLVVLLGDAANKAEEILRELAGNAATAVVPVAILSEDASLDARVRFSRHGAVAVVPKSASLDEMARRISKLALELPDRSGSILGEVGEASVDELVDLLSAEVKSGILSVAPAGASEGARVVLRSGRPVSEAISAFVERIRPLVQSSEPLRYEFHESPTGRLDVLDADTVGDTDPGVLAGRRVLVIEEKVARADMLAQELRARGATVVLTDGEGEGLERARALDPELLLVDEDGLDGWAYGVMSELRRDAGLRWASVLVVRDKELWAEDDAPPRIDRLVAGISALMAPEIELEQRAAHDESFELRLETLGPVRTLRALLRSGQTLHLTVRHPRAMVEVDLAEGLVAGAEATFMGDASGRLGGPAALATLLVLSAGRVKAHRQDRPSVANLLAPLDDAVAAARREKPPLRPSLPPPAPARPATRSKAEATTGNADAEALVSRLEGLLERLEGKLPEDAREAPKAAVDSEAPTGTLAAVAPRIPPPPPPPKLPPPPMPPPVLAPKAPKASPPAPSAGRQPEAPAQTPDGEAESPAKSGGRAGSQEVVVGVPTRETAPSEPAPLVDGFRSAPPPAPALPSAPLPPAPPPEPEALDSEPAPLAPSPAPLAPPHAPVDEAPETEAPAMVWGTSAPDAVATEPAPPLPTATSEAPELEPLTLPRSGPSAKTLALVGLAALFFVGVGYAAVRLWRGLHSPAVAAVAEAPGPAAAPAESSPAAPPTTRDLPPRVENTPPAPALADAGASDEANTTAEDAGAGEARAAEDPGAEDAATEGDISPDTTDEEVADEGDITDGEDGALAEGDTAADEGDEPLPTNRAERVRALLRAGNFQRHLGRHRVAEARYRAVLRLDRRNGRALAGLARVAMATHRNAEAVRLARRLVRTHPQQAGNRVLLGDALTAAGDRAGAQRAYRAALQKDPHHRAALRRLGR